MAKQPAGCTSSSTRGAAITDGLSARGRQMNEKSERTTRVTLDEAAALPDRTDYARLDAMTDEDIARAVANDPDACPVDADWSDAWLTIPAGIQHRYLSVDDDVVEWFRNAAGDDYRDLMRDVLR